MGWFVWALRSVPKTLVNLSVWNATLINLPFELLVRTHDGNIFDNRSQGTDHLTIRTSQSVCGRSKIIRRKCISRNASQGSGNDDSQTIRCRFKEAGFK